MYSIAIDGPAGAGKTTVAKMLAKELGFRYVNTGAMYRTIAYEMIRKGKNLDNIDEVLNTIDMKIDMADDGSQHMFLDNADVTEHLNTQNVAKLASDASAYPQVREFLLGKQRELADRYDVIMEGRDIGSVILPNADLKFYLTADILVRARRRALQTGVFESTKDDAERREKLIELAQQMHKRDTNDMTRKEAPLRQVEDAILIDSSECSAQTVVLLMLKHFHDYKASRQMALTADKQIVNVGDDVYAIVSAIKIAHDGRTYARNDKLCIRKVKVNEITLFNSYHTDKLCWCGTASGEIPYFCVDGSVTGRVCGCIDIGPFNTFSTMEEAEAHFAEFANGIKMLSGEPPMPAKMAERIRRDYK